MQTDDKDTSGAQIAASVSSMTFRDAKTPAESAPQSPHAVALAILSLRPDPFQFDSKSAQVAFASGHKLAREAAARLAEVSGAVSPANAVGESIADDEEFKALLGKYKLTQAFGGESLNALTAYLDSLLAGSKAGNPAQISDNQAGTWLYDEQVIAIERAAAAVESYGNTELKAKLRAIIQERNFTKATKYPPKVEVAGPASQQDAGGGGHQHSASLPEGFVLLQRHEGNDCYAACLDGGRFHGWLMWRHPDGQWVSKHKLEPWEVMQAEDQRDDGIVHETSDKKEGA